MTAVLFDEVVAVAPARNLRVVPDITKAPAPKKNARPASALPFGLGHDPIVDGVAILLTYPVRHVYAALLRAGVLEVRA
ncbi:Rv1535 family protein [Mycobacterium genavense]|uniref:Rv1535 family protein n=1 Tax=Mycobacterium genavense TaxID=36812 RepID=UPI00046F9679|nr:Rv1535 family protein [Mycobacterium genavense]